MLRTVGSCNIAMFGYVKPELPWIGGATNWDEIRRLGTVVAHTCLWQKSQGGFVVVPSGMILSRG